MTDHPQPEQAGAKISKPPLPDKEPRRAVKIIFKEGATYERNVHALDIGGGVVVATVFDRWDKNGKPHTNQKIWPFSEIRYLQVTELDRPEPSLIIVPKGIIDQPRAN